MLQREVLPEDIGCSPDFVGVEGGGGGVQYYNCNILINSCHSGGIALVPGLRFALNGIMIALYGSSNE